MCQQLENCLEHAWVTMELIICCVDVSHAHQYTWAWNLCWNKVCWAQILNVSNLTQAYASVSEPVRWQHTTASCWPMRSWDAGLPQSPFALSRYNSRFILTQICLWLYLVLCLKTSATLEKLDALLLPVSLHNIAESRQQNAFYRSGNKWMFISISKITQLCVVGLLIPQ